jgi:hypothetical protein
MNLYELMIKNTKTTNKLVTQQCLKNQKIDFF